MKPTRMILLQVVSFNCQFLTMKVGPFTYVQGAAEWTPTFLSFTGKGVTWVGRRGRWQQFGRLV